MTVEHRHNLEIQAAARSNRSCTPALNDWQMHIGLEIHPNFLRSLPAIFPASGLDVLPATWHSAGISEDNAPGQSPLLRELHLAVPLPLHRRPFMGWTFMTNGRLLAAASDSVLQGYHMANANISGKCHKPEYLWCFKRPKYDHKVSEDSHHRSLVCCKTPES